MIVIFAYQAITIASALRQMSHLLVSEGVRSWSPTG
jgi:hypothetical protein